MNQNLKEKIMQIIDSDKPEVEKMQQIEQVIPNNALLNFLDSFKLIGSADKLESVRQFFSLRDEEIKYIYESGFFEKKLIIQIEVNPQIIQQLINEDKITVNLDGKYIPSKNAKSYYNESTGKPAIDFTNPENQERLRIVRCLYKDIQNNLKKSIGYNEQSGESLETFINNLSPDKLENIAKICVETRNRSKVIARIFNTSYERSVLGDRNVGTYGDSIGPEFDSLKNKYRDTHIGDPKYLGMSEDEKERMVFIDAYKSFIVSSFKTDSLTNVLVGLIVPAKEKDKLDEDKTVDGGLSDSAKFDAENAKANEALNKAGQELGNVVIEISNLEYVDQLSSISKK